MSKVSKLRGFEVVVDEQRGTPEAEIIKPIRADKRSAGYDFFAPYDIEILPSRKTIVFTDVKAYMQEDEVLKLYVRSSMGIKQGLMVANGTGIVDSSYYNNPGNDGNIGVALVNTSPKTVVIKEGERFAQGVFQKYLVADEDEVVSAERTGGFGSSGK